MRKSAALAISVLLTICLVGVVDAGGFGPAQGRPVPSLASLGANLQNVTDEGAITTTAITASGANVFAAPGVTTTFTGAGTDVTVTDGVVNAPTLRGAPSNNYNIDDMTSTIGVRTSGLFGWSAGNSASGAKDTGLSKISAGHAAVGNGTVADTSGTLSLAALGARAATTDTATVDLVVTAMDAYEQATGGQDTGSDLILAGGLGVHSTEVVDFSQTAYTVTVTVNGTAKVLTEGSASPDGWTNVTSNSVSATALAVEISLITGVTATAVAAVVHITADSTVYSLLLEETGTGNTVVNNADGAVDLGTSVLRVPAGKPSAVAIQIGGEVNDGWYAVSANRIAVAVDGIPIQDLKTTGTIFRESAQMNDDQVMGFGSGGFTPITADRFLQGEATVLVDDAATEFAAIQSALGDAGGGTITYTAKLTDATGVRASRSGTLTFQTLDGAAGVIASIGDVGQTSEESGTTTWAFAIDTTDDGDLEITCQTTTTLTPTAIVLSWSFNCSGDVTLNATP